MWRKTWLTAFPAPVVPIGLGTSKNGGFLRHSRFPRFPPKGEPVFGNRHPLGRAAERFSRAQAERRVRCCNSVLAEAVRHDLDEQRISYPGAHVSKPPPSVNKRSSAKACHLPLPWGRRVQYAMHPAAPDPTLKHTPVARAQTVQGRNHRRAFPRYNSRTRQ